MIYLVLLSFAAFAYLIVTLQIRSGFPPLYEKYDGPMDDEIKPILPFVFALMAIMLAATVISELFFLFGAVSAWCGIRVRKSVKERTNGPRSWILNPLTFGIFNRWPMLAFDVWSLGMITLSGFVIFLAG